MPRSVNFAAHLAQRIALEDEVARHEVRLGIGLAGEQVALAQAAVEHRQAGADDARRIVSETSPRRAERSSSATPSSGPKRPRSVAVPKRITSKCTKLCVGSRR